MRQPVLNVYDIVDEPAATPVTTPVVELTVAFAVLLLAHTPLPASLSMVVWPTHTLAVPDIDAGNGLTVTTVVVIQPVAST